MHHGGPCQCRGTLTEEAGLNTTTTKIQVSYVLYVAAVAMGHNVPPLVRAERAAWHETRAVSGGSARARKRQQERQQLAAAAEVAADHHQATAAVLAANAKARGVGNAGATAAPPLGETVQDNRPPGSRSPRSWQVRARCPCTHCRCRPRTPWLPGSCTDRVRD